MAKFTPKKIVLDEINYGNQFRDGDGITTEAINAPIEASAFAQAIATNTPDYTRAHLVGNPKVSIRSSGDGTPRLVFENLKGEKGDKGEIPAEWGDAIKLNSKKISNLEAIVSNDAFISDSSVAYQKSVPVSVAPYATIDKIGGMTYKDGNALKHAKVMAIKSKGANLWNPYVTEIIALGWVDSKNQPIELSEDVWYQGLTGSGYWDSRHVSNVQFSNNKISFGTDLSGYGMTRAFKCKPNTAYAFSFEYEGNVPESCSAGYYDKNGNWLDYKWDAKDIVTPDNCFWIVLALTPSGATSNCTFSNIMFAESNVEIPYTPYVGTIDTFTIPESVQSREGYGLGVNENYYNYIEYANGRVKLDKRVKMGVVSKIARVSWINYSNVDFYAFNMPSDYIGYKTDAFMLEDFNKKPSHSNWDSTDFIGVAAGLATEYEIWVGFPKGTTQTEAEAALLGKSFVYALATPEVIDITDLMPSDNYIKIEGGGTIIADNEYEYAVPTTMKYQKRG